MSRFARRAQRVSPPTGRLYINPPSGSYSNGATVTVTIRENSGTAGVNAVQANLTYPTARLQFVSANTTGSPFTTTIENTGGSGSVHLGVGLLGNSVTGDQLIGTVTFTAIGTGATAVSFDTGSGIARASDSVDICNVKDGASYTIS